MADSAAPRQPMHSPSLRKATTQHPIAAYLDLALRDDWGLALVPVLTGPTPLPHAGNQYDPIINTIGCAGSAFVVTAIAGSRGTVRDLAWRCRGRCWREGTPSRADQVSLQLIIGGFT